MAFRLNVNYVRVLLIDKFDRMTVDSAINWFEGGWPPTDPPKVDDEILAAVKAEFERLEALTKEELSAEYGAYYEREKAKEAATYWFNQDYCKADYSHWVRMPYWSLEEGFVLISGRDPRKVTLRGLERNDKHKELTVWLNDNLVIAERSAALDIIHKVNTPKVFISWARDSLFNIPENLEMALTEFGTSLLTKKQQIKELEEHVLELKNLLKTASEPTEKLAEANGVLVEAAEKQSVLIQHLKSKLVALEAESDEKGPDSRYLKSLHKVVISVASDCYGLKVGSNKGSVIRDVLNAAAEVGIEITDDTVRKILKNAEKFLANQKSD